MKLEFSLFDKAMAFDKSSGFVKQVISPKTGSVFSVSTKPNDPVMKISYHGLKGLKSKKGLKPKSGATEHVLKIPLPDKPWHVSVDKDKYSLFVIDGPRPRPKLTRGGVHAKIVIDGPYPKTGFISIGGPRPKSEPGDIKAALTIKLDPKQGNWHVTPDSAGQALDISFDGPKKGGSSTIK
jgi:hypothetical protein